MALGVSASPAAAGGLVVTASDPDYHAAAPGQKNTTGARHFLQRAVEHVVSFGPPKILLVTDTRNPGGDQSDPRLGLTAAGLTFDVADDGAAGGGVKDLHTVDFSDYNVIIVASDFGGWLRQEEVDILNARTNDLHSYLTAGGGLIVLGETGSRKKHVGVDSGRYGFLSFLSPTPNPVRLDQHAHNYVVTPEGFAFGLTTADVNDNASHGYFTSTSGLDVLFRDAAGRPVALASPPFYFVPGGGGGGGGGGNGDGDSGGIGGFEESCGPTLGIRSVAALPRRHGALLRFRRRLALPVTVKVLQVSRGRHIYRRAHVMAAFRNQTRSVRWNGRNHGTPTKRTLTDGYYLVRWAMKLPNGSTDRRRRTLLRRHGRFVKLGRSSLKVDCKVLRFAKLRRVVFGGFEARPLQLRFRPTRAVHLGVAIYRNTRLVQSVDLGTPTPKVFQKRIFAFTGLKRHTAYRVVVFAIENGIPRTVARVRTFRL
jgi:hypothetical protein